MMSTSNLREIEDNRDVSSHENTHLSDRRDGSAQNRGRQQEIHGDSQHARNPHRRRSLHRNLNPSPPSGHHMDRREDRQHERDHTPPVNNRTRANPEQRDWERWLDERLEIRERLPTGRTAHDIAKKALDQIASTPFVEEIEARRPPRRFTPPQFIPYDGKSDPISHIRHYKQVMALWSGNESLMCRVFTSSLGESALRWFHKLPSGTVSSWKQLAELFTARFIANSKQPKGVDYLLTIQMNEYEGLRQYARRYWEAYNEIDECSEQLAVAQFKIGLPREHRLRQSLAKRPALGMPELMQRIEQHSRVEEDLLLPVQENSNGESSEAKRPRRKDANNGGWQALEGINTVFKEPIYRILPQIKDKPYFKWPPKMAGDPNTRDQKKFCSYHRERGHMTESCRNFKDHLEDLVEAGHLDQHIDHAKMKKLHH